MLSWSQPHKPASPALQREASLWSSSATQPSQINELHDQWETLTQKREWRSGKLEVVQQLRALVAVAEDHLGSVPSTSVVAHRYV